VSDGVAKEKLGVQTFDLISDDIVYVLTGHAGETLKAKTNGVFLESILKQNEGFTIDTEREADIYGARLLCRAGKDPMSLARGVRKISHYLKYKDDEKLMQDGSRGRAYPSLNERIAVIQAEADNCARSRK
jgi:predicted Zn-dependent protease